MILSSSNPIPPGWTCAPLSDVTIDGVEQSGPEGSGDFVYVDISAIDNKAKLISSPSRIACASAPSRARQQLCTGDVLVSMTRPNLNAVAIVPARLNGAIGSTGFHVLRACGVDPGWIFYAVQHPSFISELTGAVQGALYPAVRPKDILGVVLPVPPLREQRRIVAVLEEQLSELDVAASGLRRSLTSISQYWAALLDQMLRSLSTESGVGETSLGDVVDTIDQGWSPRCEQHPAAEGEWAIIKTTAIQPMAFCAHENKQLPSALVARPALQLRALDLLVTRAGPRSRVGVSCVVPADQPRLMNCDKVYRIRLKLDRVRAPFVAALLNSPTVLRRIDELKSGISDSGLNLTQERFLALKIPIPGLRQQDIAVGLLEASQTVVRGVTLDVELALARVSRLRQALLRAAFEGLLVSQDPNDEPASALLERIRGASKAPSRRARSKSKPLA